MNQHPDWDCDSQGESVASCAESPRMLDTGDADEPQYYTIYVKRNVFGDQLRIWSKILDIAWEAYKPQAHSAEKDLYHICIDSMTSRQFDVDPDQLVEWCKILSLKFGIRCDPMRYCVHYPENLDPSRRPHGIPPQN